VGAKEHPSRPGLDAARHHEVAILDPGAHFFSLPRVKRKVRRHLATRHRPEYEAHIGDFEKQGGVRLLHGPDGDGNQRNQHRAVLKHAHVL